MSSADSENGQPADLRWSEVQRAMLREMGLPVVDLLDRVARGAVPNAATEALAGRALAGAPGEPHATPPIDAPAFEPAFEPADRSAAVAAAVPATAPAAATHGEFGLDGQPPSRGGPAASPPARRATAPARPGSAATAHPAPLVRADIAAMDWPALRSAVAGCRACGLCEGRRHTVFGVGHQQAQWMIVGEAPGEQEDQTGEPFVGKAGQLLDNMLHALGLTRKAAPPERQVFIANTLKCRPPRNRNPQPEEMRQCEPFLQRQIALVRPRILLAMGAFAVKSLLRTDEPVGQLRGREHRYEGVPLVVTYHPAYLLRNPADKAKSWQDLCFAAEVAGRVGGAARASAFPIVG